MRMLAIHAGSHDASAAVFDDYRLVAAVAEERLCREKGWGGSLPWLAIDEVLRIADWTRRDVDVIAMTRGFFPRHVYRYPLLRDLSYTLRQGLGVKLPDRAVIQLCRRYHRADAHAVFRVERFLCDNGFRPRTQCHFVNHHEAHALAALFHTDWTEALVYTSDGEGDNVSHSMRVLKGGRLDCLYGDERLSLTGAVCEGGLARAYGYATSACGFRMLRHEGKLVGLAAFGEPKLADALATLFRVSELGVVEYIDPSLDLRAKVFEICSGQDRATIAASIQRMVEELATQSVLRSLERTGTRRLALCGGLFANVRLNRLLAETLPVDEIFIYPAMGDEGLPVGAGLAYLLQRDGLACWLAHRYRIDNLYLGRDFNGGIDRCLDAEPRVRRLPGRPDNVAVELIRAGKVGAIYVGRMEFGPRALGARSIIASPHDPTVNDLLNRRLDRSEFMPFAPIVLEDDAARVFDITDVNRYAAHFMTITCMVKPEWRTRIPGVVHVDGTARPQILNPAVNPLMASILSGFREATRLPVLINTSLNVHEEPIVNRPEQCLRALLDNRVDFVVARDAAYVTA